MSKYRKGNIVKATVTGIESYGVFVSFDEYYKGLIHISEITDKFVRNITDFVEVGDIINVRILDASNKSNQLRLSAKDVNDDLYKNKPKKIKETVFGFYLLKSALPSWIEEKMKEINKKNQNSLDNH